MGLKLERIGIEWIKIWFLKRLKVVFIVGKMDYIF